MELEESKLKEKRLYASLGKLNKKVEELENSQRIQPTVGETEMDENYFRKIAREEARNAAELDRLS